MFLLHHDSEINILEVQCQLDNHYEVFQINFILITYLMITRSYLD